MDASQIIKLQQKQNTRYLHRPQTVDSSTLLWRTQLQSSTYVPPTTAVSSLPDSVCCGGGQGRDVTLSTGATQRYPNPMASAKGSGGHLYSSDALLLQRAGRHVCAIGTPPTMELSTCYCEMTNHSDTVTNNQSNPYLPAFDTYYRFKHPAGPCIDQHQKHFVLVGRSSDPSSSCDGCVSTPSS